MTQQAELVVWADVEKVTALPAPTPGTKRSLPWDEGQIAHLRVREAWRGTARAEERIEVHFNGSFICPAPASYEPGQVVVAFLVRGDGEWRTVGMSYGTRYPRGESAVEAYRRAVKQVRVAEEQAIVARAAHREASVKAALTDWQVFVAAYPATRWDGLYGLVPEADEDHFFYDHRSPRAVSLFREQREQLVRGFVESPPLDRTLPMMLTALRGHESVEVDRVAAQAMETVLTAGAPPRWAHGAFQLLRERYGEKPTDRSDSDEDRMIRTMLDATGGPAGPRLPDASPLLREWQRFKQRHHLEPKLLPLPMEPLSGTGGDTPL